MKLDRSALLDEMVYQGNVACQVLPVLLEFQEKMVTKEILDHPGKKDLKDLKEKR